MPFSKPVIVLRVTKSFPFLFIMLGNRKFSRDGWKKMREKEREGFPSHKEKKNRAWPISEPHSDVADFKLTIQPNWTGRNQVLRP